MSKFVPLIPRFPGSKRLYQKKFSLWGNEKYDCVIEPFAGSGSISLQLMLKGVEYAFLSDADPSIEVIYKAWLGGEHQRVYAEYDRWRWAVRKYFKDSDLALLKRLEKVAKKFDGPNPWKSAYEYVLKNRDMEYLEQVWGSLKESFDAIGTAYEDEIPELAGVSLALRALTFGGVIRHNETTGRLNVRYVACQLPKFVEKGYHFPQLAGQIDFSSDWKDCIKRAKRWAEANPDKSAIAIIDPPYYVPADAIDPEVAKQRKQKGMMTPAYPGHKPHDLFTLQMCTEAFEELASIPQVSRVVVTNYFSRPLDLELRKTWPNLTVHYNGKLDGINQSRESSTRNVEAIWMGDRKLKAMPISSVSRSQGGLTIISKTEKTNVVFFSSGIGSWAAAKRVAEKYGTDNLVLLFADTLIEDKDNYRFLVEAAENVGGKLITVCDGRTPFQLWRDRRAIANNKMPFCSTVLKQDVCRHWCVENEPILGVGDWHIQYRRELARSGRRSCPWPKPAESSLRIFVGIDWSETHRLPTIQEGWLPWEVEAPLCDAPYLDKNDLIAWAKTAGLTPPRLYGFGFPHANCGGACVRAGQAQWKLTLEVLPEVYQLWEAEEKATRELVGDYSILKSRVGGTARPLTLEELRLSQEPVDPTDWGGCGCFIREEEVA